LNLGHHLCYKQRNRILYIVIDFRDQPHTAPLRPQIPNPQSPIPKTHAAIETQSQFGKYSHHKKPVFPKNSPIDPMPTTEKPKISRVLVQGSNPTTPKITKKFHLLQLATDHWPPATDSNFA
jgi:hypothetical protein